MRAHKALSTSWMEMAAAITMAHVLTWRSWALLLGPSPQHFFMPRPVSSIAAFTLGFLILLLVLLFTDLLKRAEAGATWASGIWGLATLVALASVGRPIFLDLIPTARLLGFAMKGSLATLVAGAILALIRFVGIQKWMRVSRSFCQVGWPIALILWAPLLTGRPRRIFAAGASKPPLAQNLPSAHPIWVLLFDELDYRLAFETPEVVQGMEELHRFQRESISFTQATPPGRFTLSVVPSLLLGESYPQGAPLSLGSMKLLPLSGGSARTWRGEGTLFSDLAREGRTASVIGWYLPYGRLLAHTGAEVQWEPYAGELGRLACHETWFPSLLTHVLDALPAPGLSPRDLLIAPETIEVQHTETYRHIQSQLGQLVDAPPRDLSWIHLPVPHGPAVLGGHSYLDNLRQVEAILSDFRRGLEVKGTWSDSTVIVMSDHWLRKPEEPNDTRLAAWTKGIPSRWDHKDHRVPFLVKLPGMAPGGTYGLPISTVILHDLVLALTHGTLHSPQDLKAWVDANRARFPITPSSRY